MEQTETFQISSLTDPGQVRDHNEDSVATCAQQGVVVLADGMGGYNAGEVASAMATSLISECLREHWTAGKLQGLEREAAISLSHQILQKQMQDANAAICARAQTDAACEGMCTTVVACLFHDGFVTVGHIGDSRLYRLRGDTLEQLTRDHSLLQEQIDAGMISKEDAHLSNNRNLVTRAVGIEPEVEAEIHSHDTLEQDIYLLCSDGLHGMIDDDEIQMTLSALKANLDLCAEHLVQAANDAGGHDNISVILVRIVKGAKA